MTTFDQRKKAFEDKFANDAELQFKVEARRNKLLGLWAAELMGKPEAEANAYAMSVIEEDLRLPGTSDVVEKLINDFTEASVKMTPKEIEDKIFEFEEKAKQQMIEAE